MKTHRIGKIRNAGLALATGIVLTSCNFAGRDFNEPSPAYVSKLQSQEPSSSFQQADPTATPAPSRAPSSDPTPPADPASDSTPAPSPTADPTIPGSIQGTELQPLELSFASVTSSGATVTGLPAGAAFDTSSSTVRWIPKRGQAGTYTFSVGAPAERSFTVVIKPVQESALAAGPAGYYNYDDVGYVFLHGMTQTDLCADSQALSDYWGGSPYLVAPLRSNRTVACYDGSKRVADTAPAVARQILAAGCGKFGKCIVVTHSMGGLMIEFMMTHARLARSTDPDPSLFAEHALYQQVKDRVLFVISLASAAGGSKVANMLDDPDQQSVAQEFVGKIANIAGAQTGAVQNLEVEYASDVVAPMGEDPGVPIFMIPGYSKKTASEAGAILGPAGGLIDAINGYLFDNLSPTVFNGDRNYAALDLVASFGSRSDGIVDFRSSCGIMSDDAEGGPGSGATLAAQMKWCLQTPKKANHYVWFLANSNHSLLTTVNDQCSDASNPCEADFPTANSFAPDSRYRGYSAVQVIRDKLSPLPSATNRVPAFLF